MILDLVFDTFTAGAGVTLSGENGQALPAGPAAPIYYLLEYNPADLCDHVTNLPGASVSFTLAEPDQGYYRFQVRRLSPVTNFHGVSIHLTIDGECISGALCTEPPAPGPDGSDGINTVAANFGGSGAWGDSGVEAPLVSTRGPAGGCGGFWLGPGDHTLRFFVWPWEWDFVQDNPPPQCWDQYVFYFAEAQLIPIPCDYWEYTPPPPPDVIRLTHAPGAGVVRYRVPGGSTGRVVHHG